MPRPPIVHEVPDAIRLLIDRWRGLFEDRYRPDAGSLVETHDRVLDLIERLAHKSPKSEDLALMRDRAENVRRSIHSDRVWRDLIAQRKRGNLAALPASSTITNSATAVAFQASLQALGPRPNDADLLDGLRRTGTATPLDEELLEAYVVATASRLRRLRSRYELRDLVPRTYALRCWEPAVAHVRQQRRLLVADVGPRLLSFVVDDAIWAREPAEALEARVRRTVDQGSSNNAIERVAMQLAYAPESFGYSPGPAAFAEVARRAIRIALGLRIWTAREDPPPDVADVVEQAFVAAGIARPERPDEANHRLRRRRFAMAACDACVAALAASASKEIASAAPVIAARFAEAVDSGLVDGSLRRAEAGRITELQTIFADVVPAVLSLVQRAAAGSFALDDDAFWDGFPAALVGHSPSSSSWKDRLPDHPIASDLHGGIRALVDALSFSPTLHHVFHRIEEMEVGGHEWTFGDIEFFDPTQRRAAFDPYLSREGKAVVARTPVMARGTSEARHLAEKKLGIALDVLTFGMTAFEEHGGLAARLASHVAIVTPDGRSSGGGGSLKYARSVETPNGDEIQDLLSSYAPVMAAWAQGTNHRLPHLETRVRAALSWYRRARWQPDLTRRALEYWIALEHFFVSGKKEKKAAAARRSAMLHITWRNLPQAEMYRQLHHRATRLARSDAGIAALLDGDATLAQWDRDDGILLDAARIARFSAAIAPVAGPRLGAILEEHVQSLLGNETIVLKLIAAQRWDVQLVLEQVQAARNDIVHAADSLAGHERAAANLLELVVEDAILKVVQYVLDASNSDDTIEAVLQRCHAPFPPPALW